MTSILTETINDPVRCQGRCAKNFQGQVLTQVRATLGESGTEHAHRHGHSRNTTIYKLGADADQILVKIDDSKPASAIDTEFRSLERLHQIGLRSDSLACPEPRVLLEGQGAYACTVLEGRRWASSLFQGNTDPAHSGARLAKALTDIHVSWSQPSQDLGGVFADLHQYSPWMQSKRRRGMLEAATERLTDIKVPWARLHTDFDPVNLLDMGDRVGVLDPPDQHINGPVHWDLAVFTIGIVRARLRRPDGVQPNASARSQRHRAAFLDTYASQRHLEWSTTDEVLLTLMELVRLAQLWDWASHPWRSHQRVRRTVRSAAALPVIRILAEQRSGRLGALMQVRT